MLRMKGRLPGKDQIQDMARKTGFTDEAKGVPLSFFAVTSEESTLGSLKTTQIKEILRLFGVTFLSTGSLSCRDAGEILLNMVTLSKITKRPTRWFKELY